MKIAKVQQLQVAHQSGITTPKLGQIAVGQRFQFLDEKGGEKPAGLGRLIESTVIVTTAGTVAFGADKIAAMPVPQLATLLEQTPQFTLTPQSAQTVAENMKSFANTLFGHYVIVGVSGGLISVGITSHFWPQASYRAQALVFLGGALLLVFVIWILSHYGIVAPKSTPR